MRIIRTIPLFLGIAAVWLFVSGCSKTQPPLVEGESEVLDTQTEISFVGRVDGKFGDVFDVTNVDGVSEEIRFSDQFPIDLSTNDLLKIIGTRDRATQIITATSWEKINSTDLYIISPNEGATVTSPIFINGFLPVSFGGLLWSIETFEGQKQQGELRIISDSEVAITPFHLELFPLATTNRELQITLTPLNPINGSDFDVRTVNLLSLKNTPLNLFFSKDLKSCGAVVPIVREVSETASVPRAALEELFAGPSTKEYEDGFFTALSEFSTPSVVIQEGVAEVRLKTQLPLDVCKRLTAEAQIRATLEAIPFVNEVRLLIE